MTPLAINCLIRSIGLAWMRSARARTVSAGGSSTVLRSSLRHRAPPSQNRSPRRSGKGMPQSRIISCRPSGRRSEIGFRAFLRGEGAHMNCQRFPLGGSELCFQRLLQPALSEPLPNRSAGHARTPRVRAPFRSDRSSRRPGSAPREPARVWRAPPGSRCTSVAGRVWFEPAFCGSSLHSGGSNHVIREPRITRLPLNRRPPNPWTGRVCVCDGRPSNRFPDPTQ